METQEIADIIGELNRFRTSDGRYFFKIREVESGRGEHGCHWGVLYEAYMLKTFLRFGVPPVEMKPAVDRLLRGQQPDGTWLLRYRKDDRPLTSDGVEDSTGDRIIATSIALSSLLEVPDSNPSILRKGAEYLLSKFARKKLIKSRHQ